VEGTKKKEKQSGLIPAILPTWEAEIRRIVVQGQPEQEKCM
jgi:hypothetical protein